jgi:predicted RNA-binding protein YlqC (UPF0109 family)
MLEFVRFVLEHLVESPDQIRIKQIDGDTTVILEISVAQEDMGHVIGKGGRVINSLRELCSVCARSSKKKIVIEVV